MDTTTTPASLPSERDVSRPSNLTEGQTALSGTGSSNLEQMFAHVDQTGILMEQVQSLSQDIGVVHKRAITNLQRELTVLTEQQLKLSVERVLTSLVRAYGMSWSDVARAAGVSQQAIRKWRQGGRPSPESRERLAQLGACLELLGHAEIEDPAFWLELPIVTGFSPKRFDLFLLNHHYELVALGRGEISPENAIACLDPGWQEAYRLRHVVFLDTDGELSIKAR